MELVSIHGSCVVLEAAGKMFDAPADAGVLILGESGSGKSDLALRLIERGAVLVADDRVDLSVQNDRLCAGAPSRLAGLIEIRGVGIVAMRHQPMATIMLVVCLTAAEAARLPERAWYTPPSGLVLAEEARPPLIALSADPNSAPAKILAAAGAFANARFRFECNPP